MGNLTKFTKWSKGNPDFAPNTLIIFNSTHSDENATPSSKVFQFDMKALRELLKAQSEQNPTASYFNIDILKYQVSTGYWFRKV